MSLIEYKINLLSLNLFYIFFLFSFFCIFWFSKGALKFAVFEVAF